MLSDILEWAVVAIPIVIGLILWVIPIKEPRRSHRLGVLIGCVSFSVLIYWQQHAARQEHAAEMAKLPTKDDLKRLPTASEIVGEFKRIAPAGVNRTPWGMTDEQLAKLTERISIYAPFSPETGSIITAVLGDSDSMKFAGRLAEVFKAAHWKGFKDAGFKHACFDQAIFAQAPEGIIISIREKDDQPPGLFEFVKTLRESGIEPKGQIDAKVPKDEFRITVGLRPSQ